MVLDYTKDSSCVLQLKYYVGEHSIISYKLCFYNISGKYGISIWHLTSVTSDVYEISYCAIVTQKDNWKLCTFRYVWTCGQTGIDAPILQLYPLYCTLIDGLKLPLGYGPRVFTGPSQQVDRSVNTISFPLSRAAVGDNTQRPEDKYSGNYLSCVDHCVL